MSEISEGPIKVTVSKTGPVHTASIGTPPTRIGGQTQSGVPVPGVIDLDPTDYNVVVILIDDVGREKYPWSGLGSSYAAMPRLEEMRALGVTFQNAYATPICGPTRATVQTGTYAFRNGLGGNIEATDVAYRLSDSNVFLPEILALGRPDTVYLGRGVFGKWHMCGYQGQDGHPFDNGWARYFGCLPNAGSDNELGWFNGSGHYRWRKVTTATSYAYVPPGWTPQAYSFPDGLGAYDHTTYDACVNVRDALAWANTRTTPFICYLPLNPPHAPFERPPNTMPDDTGFGATGGTVSLVPDARRAELDGMGIAVGQKPGDAETTKNIASFKSAMECIDSLIGWFNDRLDPAIRAKTVFIVWGDNGTVAGVIESPYSAGHAKRTVFEQGVWTTGIIWGPPRIVTQPGRDFLGMAHSVDLCRTIADICKVRWNLLDASVARDSVSLLPVLRDPSITSVRSRLYSELFLPLGGPPLPNQWQRALSDGTWKLQTSLAVKRFFRVGTTPGFSSGQPGYLELAEDDYLPTIATTAPADAKAAYASLSAEILALTGSAA